MSMLKKPIVVEKVHKYVKALKKNGGKVGKIPRSITLNYHNACNFKCVFCFSEAENKYAKVHLEFDEIARVADEAHELGVWEIVLTGGELTTHKETLIKLIHTFKPERFQMILITNGYLLTPEYAHDLAKAGLDCLAVSISGMNAERFNRERGGGGRSINDAHQRALNALDYATEAGLAAWPNIVFGHYNAKDPDLFALLEYAKKKKFTSYLMMAMPFGSLKGDRMTAEDFKILDGIRKNYDVCFNTWDMYDKKREKISGCWTVNRTYITPLGEVLVCPYINISIGNIKTQSYKEILDYGFSIKYFGEFSSICISAHNFKFREKFMPEPRTIFNPYKAKEIFGKEDYIE
ncbi:hypothetical protein NHP200010_16020 [Helicobacter bizzozeronii]|uniref:radical SAM/SPASM domain-containing protein n=1 Tax=Helicobacter bizzozeronii TaxID=56877 RepID=UPI000CEF01AB|nr:radical SAM protein [Helicobacter bizzozeronii]GMB93869.1 hypothetical protein NHP200010_16020 [Helicobacter bizzozeronii]